MLNKQTFTAIEVCVCIARMQHPISCSTGQLSSHLGLSVSYLELILKQLKAHDIVCSFRAPVAAIKFWVLQAKCRCGILPASSKPMLK